MNLITGYFRDLYRGTTAGWNRFWFSPTDPATLGLIRIFAGSMLFYTHLVWSFDLSAFFGQTGFLPVQFMHDLHQHANGGPDAPLRLVWTYFDYIQSPSIL